MKIYPFYGTASLGAHILVFSELCVLANIIIINPPPPPPPPPRLDFWVALNSTAPSTWFYGAGGYTSNTAPVVDTSNHDYHFECWTENDAIVSTNARFSFTIISNRTFLAHYRPRDFSVSISASPPEVMRWMNPDTTYFGTYAHVQSCRYDSNAIAHVGFPVGPPWNYSFAGWTENGILVSTQRDYTFPVTSDRVLVAEFTQMFTNAVSYSGVILSTNGICDHSGILNFTCGTNGGLLGSFSHNRRNYSISGSLNYEEGSVYAIGPNGTFWIHLNYDQYRPERITGAAMSSGVDIPLSAEFANTYSKTNPAPQAGIYTLSLNGLETEQPAIGNGFGVVTLDESGKVRFLGSLADGTPVTQSGVITSEGHWPVYFPLYGGRGAITGWIDFGTGSPQELSGFIEWVKPEGSKLYRDGFVTRATVTGSPYIVPDKHEPTWTLQTAQLTLIGGDMEELFSETLQTSSIPNVLVGDHAKVSFNPKTGFFSGRITNSGKPISFKGALLQNSHIGQGYFTSTSGSGVVKIAPVQ